MKILAVILFLGIMLSSCGNKADSERLNDSAFTTTAESSVVDSDSVEVDESSQVGDESDIQGDSSEDDMKWRLFEDTYKETDSGRAAENYAHNKDIKIEGFVKYGQENPPVCDLMLGETRFAGVGCESLRLIIISHTRALSLIWQSLLMILKRMLLLRQMVRWGLILEK